VSCTELAEQALAHAKLKWHQLSVNLVVEKLVGKNEGIEKKTGDL
jgi:hypothetical protein